MYKMLLIFAMLELKLSRAQYLPPNQGFVNNNGIDRYGGPLKQYAQSSNQDIGFNRNSRLQYEKTQSSNKVVDFNRNSRLQYENTQSSNQDIGFNRNSRLQYENTQSSNQEYVNDIGINRYSFGFQTEDGTSRTEGGELLNPGTPQEDYVVRGETSWISPEGTKVYIVYVADKNGYREKSKIEPRIGGAAQAAAIGVGKK